MTDIKNYILTCAANRGLKQADIARAIGCSPQNFNQRINRRSFTPAELQSIADVMGADLVIRFVDRRTKQALPLS